MDVPPKSREALDARLQMARVKAIVAECTLLQENPAGSKGLNKCFRRSQWIRKVLEHVETNGRVEYASGLWDLRGGLHELRT